MWFNAAGKKRGGLTPPTSSQHAPRAAAVPQAPSIHPPIAPLPEAPRPVSVARPARPRCPLHDRPLPLLAHAAAGQPPPLQPDPVPPPVCQDRMHGLPAPPRSNTTTLYRAECPAVQPRAPSRTPATRMYTCHSSKPGSCTTWLTASNTACLAGCSRRSVGRAPTLHPQVVVGGRTATVLLLAGTGSKGRSCRAYTHTSSCEAVMCGVLLNVPQSIATMRMRLQLRRSAARHSGACIPSRHTSRCRFSV